MNLSNEKLHINSITLFITGIVLLLLSHLSHAAVIASVSNNKMAKGEIFTLKIVSDNQADSGEIDFSILEDSFYMGRPSFSSSMNSINGTRSIRSEWTVSLAPLKAGNLTIPSFDVQGEQTVPIKITSSIDPKTPNTDDLVSLQAQLSKNEIYPGEIAQLNTRLIIKTDARRVQNPKLVPPGSLESLNIEPTGEAKQYLSIIDGIEATVIDQSYQITANDAGLKSITGPRFTATILDRNNNTGATRLIPVSAETGQVSINVLAKPVDFIGSWLPSPNLTLSQKWLDDNGNELTNVESISTTAGSAITREIVLTVESISPSQVPNLAVSYPPEIRYYDEPPKITQDGNKVSMTLKHVLIPKAEGNIDLPSLSVNWWNTTKKEAQTTELSGLVLTVTQSQTHSIKLDSSENLKTQPIQTPTETVIVKDSGIWPYLTALISALWLITLTLLIKKAETPKYPNPLSKKVQTV
ncbi:BatD family protein [Vibrio algarum]|uniref:BatD family protein n=1 Tax=Vibrio algarum TaxID=3020714 RepID=A0ABT4YW33_9VIBR|nr:BatD family protein [Vibrio sp. KJ40-1]MDB1125798.1 BatD family protein [Vibrio sp. KJ40-1]